MRKGEKRQDVMNLQDFFNPWAPKPMLDPMTAERQEIVDAVHDFASGAASNQPGLGAPGVNEDESLSEAMGVPDSGLQPDPEPMENAAEPGQPSLEGIVIGGANDSGCAGPARSHGRDTANGDLQHRLTAEPDPTILHAAELEFIPGPQSPAIEPVDYAAEQAGFQEEYFRMAREHLLLVPDPCEAPEQASQLGLHDSPVEPSTRRHRNGYDPLQQARPRPSVSVRYQKTPLSYRGRSGYLR
jgi:hypothetical protein